MSRIEEVIRKVETEEVIDPEREADLVTLEFVRQDEAFAGEMIEILRRLDEANTNAEGK